MPPRVSFPPKATLRLPSLNSPPSYKSFMFNISMHAENKRLLPALDKNDIDREYEALLRKKFEYNEKSISHHMQLARSQEAHQQWDRIQTARIQTYGSCSSSPEVQSLSLPEIGQHYKNASGKGRANDHMDRQTYREFADKTIQKNARVTFTKQLMDDTFRQATSRLIKAPGKTKSCNNPADVERMLKRCTGKESDE
ncbi:hypothetical protein LTR97_001032 [Elasticomyces elasticus]|uniref:Uncharacterized protein n=1 Tax=Elasticomyces elasticus TaxID=574655 RepID=A0AAN8A4V2_9PEZI|nr:hypothetical protein LTR97_001032 [Elasticomyces elasticus]